MRLNDVIGVSDAEASSFRMWRSWGAPAAPVMTPAAPANMMTEQITTSITGPCSDDGCSTDPYDTRDVAMETHPLSNRPLARLSRDAPGWVPMVAAWLFGVLTALTAVA